jgi:putative protease
LSERKEIGKITHYFSKIGVAVVELSDSISVGDTILIKGAHTEFEQDVASMQIEHESIQTAKKGQSIGLKVKQKVHENDRVFK